MNSKATLFYLQALGILALFILILWVGFTGLNPDTNAVKSANSTRTALAMTSSVLLGPFPTSTAPTAIASSTPANTLTPTRTPTRTPSQTPTRFFFQSSTPTSGKPGQSSTQFPSLTNTARPTQTRTPVPPTDIPPTNPPATDTPSYP